MGGMAQSSFLIVSNFKVINKRKKNIINIISLILTFKMSCRNYLDWKNVTTHIIGHGQQ